MSVCQLPFACIFILKITQVADRQQQPRVLCGNFGSLAKQRIKEYVYSKKNRKTKADFMLMLIDAQWSRIMSACLEANLNGC